MADTDNGLPVETSANEPWQGWLGRLAAARRRRDDASGLWQENVRKRRGADTETSAETASSKRVTVNRDWPLTKAKLALLYSNTPQPRLSTNNPQLKGKLGVFSQRVNKQIHKSSVGSAIEEELCDVINASGISGVVLSCEKRTEMRDVPIVEPSMLPPDMAAAVSSGAMTIPTMPTLATTDYRYPCRRLSPAQLLVPADFTGSNYDSARFLAYDDSMTWEQAVINLGLTDDVKEKVVGPDRRARGTTNTLNYDTNKFRETEVVNYTEVFYWRHFYHADETSFDALQRVVFVDGLDEPVIDEPYTGQKRGPDGRIIGVKRNPIQVLTLTYISDDCLPPSDSTISRPQVNELEDSRTTMVQQRRHSIPIRWFDTNRVSPGVRSLIESGTWQGLVPISGPGDRAIGEVARSAFPPERFEFDRVIQNDINDYWQLGTNQVSGFASGERSAREAGIIEKNFRTRIGHERSKVERHYVAIVEIMSALMTMHGQVEIPPEALDEVSFTIRVDSTMLLDAESRIDQLVKFLNMTVQSGFVNPKPVISEIAELSGLDPAMVVIDPKPKPPEPISISIGDPEDISNPLFLAALMATQQAPSPEHLDAAIKLITKASEVSPVPILPPIKLNEVPQGGGGGMPPVPAAPPLLPPTGPQGPQAQRPPMTPELSNPGWEEAAKIQRRSEDGGA